MSKKLQMLGILATGRTKADAVNNYRLLALGKGATMQVSESHNTAFVAQASGAESMFDPQNGDQTLVQKPEMLKKLEFASHSSDRVEVEHLVCASGCGTHVVFDSPALVNYCPKCTSSMSEDVAADEEDVVADNLDMDNEDETSIPEDDEETSESGDEAEESEETPEEEATEDESSEDESDEDSADDEGADDAEESMSSEDEPLVVVCSSLNEAIGLYRKHSNKSLSGEGTVSAEYLVCTSSDCGAHIVGDVSVSSCPNCGSATAEPSSVSESEEELEIDTGISDDEDADEDSQVDPAEEEAEEAEESEAGSCKASDEEEDTAAGDSEQNDIGISDGEETDTEVEEAPAEATPVDEESSESTEINVCDYIPESASSDDLDVAYAACVNSQSCWTAYYKGTPVATILKAQAGDNADLFDSPKFGHVAIAVAKQAGVKQALTELGFKPIRHEVSLSQEISRIVAERTEQATEQAEQAVASHIESFEAALATALIGMNRGFFQGKANPLKAALCSSLSSTGVRSPEVLVDRVFSANHDSMLKEAVALAKEIMAKPAEVQESLSRTIMDMSYQGTSLNSASGSEVEDRLAGMGSSSLSSESKAAPVKAQAVSESSGTSRTRSILQRRFLGR